MLAAPAVVAIGVSPGQIITLLGCIVLDYNEIWHADLII